MNPTCSLTPVFSPPTDPFDLEPLDGWPAQRHQFEGDSVWAIQAALATCRPLLVRGEPGTGKSQLARAAAQVMNRPFLYQVITSRTEVTDLLYEMDAVSRLAEAQVLGAGGMGREELRRELLPERFISPGKIWWATNWPEAQSQAERAGSPSPSIKNEGDWKNGCVLLIDEIDKADAELPNALLECFANQSFQVAHKKDPVRRPSEQPTPLVVVTTNEERELPAPFLRRCWVLHLALPKDDDKMKSFLIGRGKVHFDNQYEKTVSDYTEVLAEAADRLIADRRDASAGGLHKPGQAEYLDLCRAVFTIAAEQKKPAAEVLKAVAGFALRKNPQ
jgi:MoxR-like ATPase